VYAITHNIGTNVYDIAWDIAGNIYVCGNSGEYMKGFALPRAEAVAIAAPSKYWFSIAEGGVSGVENIEAEEAVAPVYYNLQGVKVANPSNGIYIVKRGAKVAKEFVK
jgi:hypothetical protein